MALHRSVPALRANRECPGKVLIAQGLLVVLLAVASDLYSFCREVPQPPGNPNGSGAITAVMQDLACSARQQIAAGAQAPMRVKSIEAPDQANPRLLQEIIELLWSELLLATGRAVGQTEVLENLLIALRNAGWQGPTPFLPEVTW